jgi:hypothetical protein
VNVEDLKILSLANVLSNIEVTDIDVLIKNIDFNSLCMIKESIEKTFDNYVKTYYMLINDCAFGLRKYSKLSKSFVTTKDENPFDYRHHPILVLTTLLLGKNSNTEKSKWSIKLVKLKPYEKYLVKEHALNLKECWNPGKSKKPFIPEFKRPDDLFAKLTQFSKDNNVELDLSRIDEFPKDGPYRIFD